MHAVLHGLMNFEPNLAGLEAVMPSDEEGFVCFGARPALQGFEGADTPYNQRVEDQRVVMAAALQPGTQNAGLVSRRLLARSLELAHKAEARAGVTQAAHKNAARFLRNAEVLDARVANLALRVLNADGTVRQGSDPALVKQLAVMRKLAVDNGRKALRFKKAEMVGRALTENSIAQADILQRTAVSVLAGRPDLVAPLIDTYAVIGGVNRAARDARRAQLAKQAQGLEGLGLDMFERELDQLEYEDSERFGPLSGLGGLGDLEWSCCKRFKRKMRKVGRAFKSAAKTVGKGIEKAAKKTYSKVLKPVGKAVKEAGKQVVKYSAKLLLEWPCKLASSTVSKVALQTAGTIVGTYYGGPVGGALGKRAGERAHDIDKSMCKAIDRIGLTKGTFRPGQVVGAFKDTAKHIAKKSLDPREALKTAMSVGAAYVGGNATSALSKAAGGKVSELGLDKLKGQFASNASGYVKDLAKKAIVKEAKKYGKGAVREALKQAKNMSSDQLLKLARKEADKIFTGNVAKLVGVKEAKELRRTSAAKLIAELAS